MVPVLYWCGTCVISVWYRCSNTGGTSIVKLTILDVQSIINQLYSDMLFNRNDCSYKTEKKLDETLRIIRRVFKLSLEWRHSLTMTSLRNSHSKMKTWIRVLQKSNEREKVRVPKIYFLRPSMIRPRIVHGPTPVSLCPWNPAQGRYNVFATTNATRIYSQLSTWAPKSCRRIEKSKWLMDNFRCFVNTGSKKLMIYFRK